MFRIFIITLLSCSTLFINEAQTQTQLNVEGTPISSDEPVVEINTQSTSGTLTTGLKVMAISNITGIGIAGHFVGSSGGVVGLGFNNAGVKGSSEAGYGIEGTSQSSFGGYFMNEMKINVN